MTKYLFLDESGDLGVNGSNYFVLVILEINSSKNSKKLDRSITKFKKRAFNRKLRNISEIKATKISDEMKFKMLDIILNHQMKIYSLVLNKKNSCFKNLIAERGANETYINLVNYLISKLPIGDLIDIKLDKFVPQKQEEFFESQLHETLEKKRISSQISFVFSQNWKEIQSTDLIAWSIFQYFENNNKKFLEKIRTKADLKIYKK